MLKSDLKYSVSASPVIRLIGLWLFIASKEVVHDVSNSERLYNISTEAHVISVLVVG